MCRLCDNPHPTVCSYNSQDYGTQVEALDCLTQKDADVTYIALNYVREYFGVSSSLYNGTPSPKLTLYIKHYL